MDNQEFDQFFGEQLRQEQSFDFKEGDWDAVAERLEEPRKRRRGLLLPWLLAGLLSVLFIVLSLFQYRAIQQLENKLQEQLKQAPLAAPQVITIHDTIYIERPITTQASKSYEQPLLTDSIRNFTQKTAYANPTLAATPDITTPTPPLPPITLPPPPTINPTVNQPFPTLLPTRYSPLESMAKVYLTTGISPKLVPQVPYRKWSLSLAFESSFEQYQDDSNPLDQLRGTFDVLQEAYTVEDRTPKPFSNVGINLLLGYRVHSTVELQLGVGYFESRLEQIAIGNVYDFSGSTFGFPDTSGLLLTTESQIRQLNYQLGIQWTPMPNKSWQPYAYSRLLLRQALYRSDQLEWINLEDSREVTSTVDLLSGLSSKGEQDNSDFGLQWQYWRIGAGVLHQFPKHRWAVFANGFYQLPLNDAPVTTSYRFGGQIGLTFKF